MKRAPAGILPLIAIDRRSPRPLYRQLYDGYRQAILEHRLREGQRLPSTRSLAQELRISRIPVLNAFEQLLAEGYFESRVGAGTFVAASLPDALTRSYGRFGAGRAAAAGRGRVIGRRVAELLRDPPGPWFKPGGAFNVGRPPVERFPQRIWAGLVSRHSRNVDPKSLLYHPPMGLESLRTEIAAYLRTSRAVRCEAAQIMIVSGSQQALDLTARVLLDAGSPVWLEDPGYFGARRSLRMAGARLVPVPVDEKGLDVAAGIARSARARAVFVTPSHQFPLGVTMSVSRRLRLLDWARRAGAWIIEDDYDSEYRFGSLPIAALQGLDRDSRVIYFGTFTKMLFPALRLAYIVLPEDLVEPFSAVRRTMDTFSPTLPQAVLADFIREGHFERHIRRTRQLCRERRDALVEALTESFGAALRVLGDEAGMFLSAALPDGWPDREIALRAGERGLGVFPLTECYLSKTGPPGFVLGFGGVDAAAIPEAVRRLREAAAPWLPGRRAARSR